MISAARVPASSRAEGREAVFTGEDFVTTEPRQNRHLDAEGRPLLEVENVTVRFGGIVALNDVTFSVPGNRIFSIIGPNGAGKTTLFNCLSRIYQPDSGSIRFDGKAIADYPQHQMANLGMGRTFQNVALFRSMSVLENVKIGAHSIMKRGFLSHAFAFRVRAEEEHIDALAREVCEKIRLTPYLHQEVSSLPFGLQKRVELARALISRPKLLMLDEPAAGLNHEEISELRDTIREISSETGVLLVEHHMNLVMAVSDYIVVLDFGKKIAEGVPEDIKVNPDVMRAYLGDMA
jgi:branched-chain amino acid transport system ATP-binding protein